MRAKITSWRDSCDAEVLKVAVKRLKRSVEVAHFNCQDDVAGDLHDDLTSAEWRLRQAVRRS